MKKKNDRKGIEREKKVRRGGGMGQILKGPEANQFKT